MKKSLNSISYVAGKCQMRQRPNRIPGKVCEVGGKIRDRNIDEAIADRKNRQIGVKGLQRGLIISQGLLRKEGLIGRRQ